MTIARESGASDAGLARISLYRLNTIHVVAPPLRDRRDRGDQSRGGYAEPTG